VFIASTQARLTFGRDERGGTLLRVRGVDGVATAFAKKPETPRQQ